MLANIGREEIFKAVRPQFHVLRFFGLAPYNLNIKQSETSGKNKKLLSPLLYQVFVIMLATASSIASIHCKELRYYITKSAPRRTSSVLYWISNSCTSVVAMIFTGIHHKQIVGILKALSTTDDVFSPSVTFYQNVHKFLIVEMLLTYLSIFAIGCYHTWIWFVAFKIDLYVIGVFVYYCIISATELQFINMVYLLYYRYKALNQRLEAEFDSKFSEHSIENNINRHEIPAYFGKEFPQHTKTAFNLKIWFEGSKNKEASLASRLRILRKHQHGLRNIGDEINGAYRVSILCDMISSFIGITVHLYASLYFATNDVAKLGLSTCLINHVIIVNLCWLVFMVVKLACVCSVCHIAGTETSRTAVLLRSALLEEQLSSPTAAEIQCFLEQAVNRPLHFSACGFFNIDYSFLGSFIGLVATYIIILMDFK